MANDTRKKCSAEASSYTQASVNKLFMTSGKLRIRKPLRPMPRLAQNVSRQKNFLSTGRKAEKSPDPRASTSGTDLAWELQLEIFAPEK
jgi:hypothetical protein